MNIISVAQKITAAIVLTAGTARRAAFIVVR